MQCLLYGDPLGLCSYFLGQGQLQNSVGKFGNGPIFVNILAQLKRTRQLAEVALDAQHA